MLKKIYKVLRTSVWDLDDIEKIFKALKITSPRLLRVSAENNDYPSIEALKVDINKKSTQFIKIYSESPSFEIVLNANGLSIMTASLDLTSDSESVIARGVFHEIYDDILKKRQRRIPYFLIRIFSLIISYLISWYGSFYLYAHSYFFSSMVKGRFRILVWIMVFLMLDYLFRRVIEKFKSRIILSKKKENVGFWQRNKDTIISGLIVGFIILGVTMMLKSKNF